jgi:hypothetical protein
MTIRSAEYGFPRIYAVKLSDKLKRLCSGIPRADRVGPRSPILSSLVPPEPRSRRPSAIYQTVSVRNRASGMKASRKLIYSTANRYAYRLGQSAVPCLDSRDSRHDMWQGWIDIQSYPRDCGKGVVRSNASIGSTSETSSSFSRAWK